MGLDWNDPATETSRQFFEQAMRAHTRVRDVSAVDDHVYLLRRHGQLSDVRVWVCDVYTLGIADYMAIRDAAPDTNAIVVLSQWNHYTPQARQQGKEDGVGIFKFGEFMSALHREGHEFLGS